MYRRIFFTVILMSAALGCFAQTSALRDYVGMISQNFHPDIVEYLRGFERDLEKAGHGDVSKSIENYLKGDSGTGFVYVAPDGKNYILTNYHVISQAVSLSVTFEKQDGEKIKYSNLSIVAADEDMDVALLAFAGGQNPFKQGLAFLGRPLQEGDNVFSAGFPGLGTMMIWQLGAGIISNVSVRLPVDEESDKMRGPFIQHTAQVDPGNSGGPLLVQTAGVPTGYAVAGINTLSVRIIRQATNYSIPMNRVQSFLDASLKPKAVDQRPLLDARVAAFVEGLDVPKAVYPHIALYLSNDCIGENAEFALTEMLQKAPRSVANNILRNSPVNVMTHSVAWTIENTLRSRAGKITASVESVSASDDGGFTVAFKVNDKTIASHWINEYGIWRIKTFGDLASGDKTLIKKRAKESADSKRLRTEPDLQLSAGYAQLVDRGPAFGADLLFRGSYSGWGMRTFAGSDSFFQLEAFGGVYIPIKLGGVVGITPFGNMGFGFQWKNKRDKTDDPDTGGLFNKFLDIGASFQGGLQFTTAAIPGLYVQAAYQYNAYWSALVDERESDPHTLFFSLGYSF